MRRASILLALTILGCSGGPGGSLDAGDDAPSSLMRQAYQQAVAAALTR